MNFLKKKLLICFGLILLTCSPVVKALNILNIHNNNKNLTKNFQKKDLGRIIPYEENYIVYTYTSNLNKTSIIKYDWSSYAKNDELLFKLSLYFPLFQRVLGKNTEIGISYTQISWWQLSNVYQSSPFRETNYEPQLIINWFTDYNFCGWNIENLEFGLNHQSNGNPDPTSRSWNRIYGRIKIRKGPFQIDIKPWYLLNTSQEAFNLVNYNGHYRIKINYTYCNNLLGLEGYFNPNSRYGNAVLSWSYPLNSNIRIYGRLFTGYCESLIDYHHTQTRLGLGFILNNLNFHKKNLNTTKTFYE